ncbi:MAG: hypothetical protein NTW74_13450 [Acidobacteria bacterium]|nr:hypothetical protein [Acidobacteriota bacterium]
MRYLLAIIAAAALEAQPPAFPPEDTEGLKASPNPQIRHAWKRKVFWKISYNNFAAPRPIPAMTVAERTQATNTLNSLTALLKATNTGSNGEGFWVNDSRTLGYQDPTQAPVNAPLRYQSGLFPFYHEDVFIQGSWRLSQAGETESVYYYFNRHPEALSQPTIAEEGRTTFYLKPQITGSLSGLNLYEGQVLIAARPGRDLWKPIPLGRALKAVLPKHEQEKLTAETRLASLKKTNDEIQSPEYEKKFRENFEKNYGNLKTTRPSGYETRLKSMERELAYNRTQAAASASPQPDSKGLWYWNPINAYNEAINRLSTLTPAQAALPACLIPFKTPQEREGRYNTLGTISTIGEATQCQDIVSTNWDYFDPKLPRSAPQLLSVHDFGRCAKLQASQIVSSPVTRFAVPAQGCPIHAQMWRELDWSQITALLQR